LRRRLLWQGGKQSKKIHLADWVSVCSPKIQGGLGVLNLEVMNDSLLSKWLWNIENSNGLWQKIIASKYLSAFRDRGSLGRRVKCRCVPQPRWVGARPSAKGGERWPETGMRGGNPAAFVFVLRPGRVRLQ
jgi:hypothetical protein